MRGSASRFVAFLVLGASLLALAVVATSLARSHGDVDTTSLGSRAQVPPQVAPSPTGIVPPPPTRVRIGRIGVDAKVLAVGLTADKAIDIPSDIRNVGWYKLGVPPGASRGSAVLVGHRDGQVQGHGVFYDLGLLQPGDQVRVVAGSTTQLYRVVAREFIAKQRLPYAELFAVDGEPRLTLISCGGYYDREHGGYQDNVVVTAVPVQHAA